MASLYQWWGWKIHKTRKHFIVIQVLFSNPVVYLTENYKVCDELQKITGKAGYRSTGYSNMTVNRVNSKKKYDIVYEQSLHTGI